MTNQPTVAFHTLGCKLNFSETSTIGRLFQQNDFKKGSFQEPADVYVINTCSVTENADRECKTIVNRALHINPEAFIVVIGCYAQLKPEEIAGIPGVDLVLGASEKFNIVQYITNLKKKEKAQVFSCEISDSKSFYSAYSHGERTRVFLKVQDGCDYTCSFCTIPLARGKSRSDTIEHVIEQAKKIVDSGAKEIVLTGVNLGDFGKLNPDEKHAYTFLDLAIELENVRGLERVRISSIEPNLITKELIELVSRSEKFVPHFHIPLQSGSDKILKQMRRRYLPNLYAEKVSYIKELIPHACIGADVIVGFPGETEGDFLDTYNFLNELDVSYLHVFTYSERENTHAVTLNTVVPVPDRKKRNKMLRILSEKKLRKFYSEQEGRTLPVLFEADNKNGVMHGFTDNYVKVIIEFNPELINRIIPCTLSGINEAGEMKVQIQDESLV